MSHWELAVLALALAVDAFSVAAAVAPGCSARWGAIRLAGAFGCFQALMPLLGALAGRYALAYVHRYDHWVAFALLELIGVKMLADALWLGKRERAQGAPKPGSDPSWGWSLLGLSLATSLDAFGAGVALQVKGASLPVACPVIGAVAAGLTYLGARLGARAGKYFGARAEVAGAVVLMALGVKLLLELGGRPPSG